MKRHGIFLTPIQQERRHFCDRFQPDTIPAHTTAGFGELVEVRSRRWLVEEVVEPGLPGQSPIVRLACADDDNQGQTLDVFWDYEPDRRILEEEMWRDLAAKGL